MYPRYLFTIFNFSLDILFLIVQVSFPSSPNPFSTSDKLGERIGIGQSAGNVGEQIGTGQSAGSVGEQIGKRPICSQFRLTNWPANSLEFMLAFRPHFDLLAGASTVSARPVCESAGLLAWRVNRPASKPVRTYISLMAKLYKFFEKYLPYIEENK